MGAAMSPERDALLALAARVRRLAPSHHDPEWFHVEKDEIERALRKLAVRQQSHPPVRSPVEGDKTPRSRRLGARSQTQ